MNDPGFLTIAAWKTANKGRQKQAEELCKNYGLSKLQPMLYAGRLFAKERKEFEQKMPRLLSGRRDLLHFFATCRSCSLNSSAGDIVGQHYKETTFEIV